MSPSEGIELAPGVSVDPADLRYAFSRSGGPGGQAVNKLSTRAELRVRVEAIRGLSAAAAARLRDLAGRRLNRSGEIVLTSQTTRSQLENKRRCLDHLTVLVEKAVTPPPKRRPTRATKASIEKRLKQKRRVARKKEARRKPEDEPD